MRTVKEMIDAALDQRAALVCNSDYPEAHEFECTTRELMLLRDQPWPMVSHVMDPERERICGLKIKVKNAVEFVDYVRVTDRELIIQLTGGGAAQIVAPGMPAEDAIGNLRRLADLLELGLARRG